MAWSNNLSLANCRTQTDIDSPVVTLTIRARLKRTGKEMKIVVEDGSDLGIPDGAWYALSSAPMSFAISFLRTRASRWTKSQNRKDHGSVLCDATIPSHAAAV